MPNKKTNEKTANQKDATPQKEDRYTASERASDFKKYEQLKRKK